MLFNKSLALNISVLLGSKFTFKSVLLSCVGSSSLSVWFASSCSSSGGSSSLSVWFASSCSSSVLSSVVVSIVWVLIISSSSSKIGVVSSGGFGFVISCICLYSASLIISSFSKYSLIMCFCSSFVGLAGVAGSCCGSCMLKYCVFVSGSGCGSCISNIL